MLGVKLNYSVNVDQRSFANKLYVLSGFISSKKEWKLTSTVSLEEQEPNVEKTKSLCSSHQASGFDIRCFKLFQNIVHRAATLVLEVLFHSQVRLYFLSRTFGFPSANRSIFLESFKQVEHSITFLKHC